MNVLHMLGTVLLLCVLSLTFAQNTETGGAGQAESDESAISMSDVPTNVRMAAQAVAGARGYEIQEVSTEVERDGRLYYEFGGEGFEIDIAADGMLDEVEEAISLEQLPQEVRDTLQQFLGDFQPSTVETSTRPDGALVYEFEGQLGDTQVDVEISADAQVMTINRD